jgi:Ca-activated chloride channel family protein
MKRYELTVLMVLLSGAGLAQAHGLLIPADRSLPPLAMLNHQVTITIEDQVAVTHVEQTFRNHTDRALEATYVFPVPNGASVRKFTMWVNGKEVTGELVEADRARQIYTDIVRRTQDPGLLEYMGGNVLRLRIFPVPAHGDQKVSLSYTSEAPQDAGVIEYVYPLRTDGKAVRTLEKFALKATVKSQHPIQNVYSPTHAITLERQNDRELTVGFEREQAPLDQDFHLYYAVGDQAVGLTALTQRPSPGEAGFCMLLLSPRVELTRGQAVPRDMVLVLDTSGSMRGPKMQQAKRALAYCLANLEPQDRFGLINFATTVNKFQDGLVAANKDQLEQGRRWVEQLEATGGTAIDDALAAALGMRTSDAGRSFTVVFFTDGCPTIGESDPQKILRNVSARNSASTRIFTFGFGDDVNATLLDQLADQTRAVSTYVRPAEDIEAKVSGLYAKISHPVLTDLKLVTSGGDVKLAEMYPPQLPDLFQGGQVSVLARYTGQGHVALRLSGTVGPEPREFIYEASFPAQTTGDRSFVEHVWARRKVGYLLDQIRANGEKKELVDETVALAKRYGIATPYTSYLVVPDAMPLAGAGRGGRLAPMGGGGGETVPPALAASAPGLTPLRVADFAREAQKKPGQLADNRMKFEGRFLEKEAAAAKSDGAPRAKVLQDAKDKLDAYKQAHEFLARRDRDAVQAGKLGVDLSVQSNNLKNQLRLEALARRQVQGRNCLEVGGVWIDEAFDAKMPTVTVKAQSDAYFRMLERQPQVKEVFQLGNHLVWVTPNGTALVVDSADGKESLPDADIDRLFAAAR